jgi:hypothetical protein
MCTNNPTHPSIHVHGAILLFAVRLPQIAAHRCPLSMPRSISPATAMTRVRPASRALEMKGPEVVVKPDYNVAIGAAALAGGLFAARAPVVAVPIAALAALFAVQAGRVRFTFDDEVALFVHVWYLCCLAYACCALVRMCVSPCVCGWVGGEGWGAISRTHTFTRS